MPLDPVAFNAGNLAPTAERPLLIIFKGHIPSLKNDRDIGITKAGRKFSRPKAEVTQAIAAIRDALDRQLPYNWLPLVPPCGVSLWMVLGAHGVTAQPDSDLDNMCQTCQEALAAPRQKDKITPARRMRLVMEDDKQVVSLHGFRRAFADKTRIYHELYIWMNGAGGDPVKDIEEYALVAKLREEALAHECNPKTG